jgi:hypothetical protein
MEKTMEKHAIFVEKSENRKISGGFGMSTTYLSIKATCPNSCVLKQTQECYAMCGGHVGMIVRRLDKGVKSNDAIKVAREEAREIRCAFRGGPIPQDGIKGGRDLRGRTSGDSRTNTTAKIFAAAIKNWKNRGGGSAWSYTHAWKDIKRSSWGKHVSILASIDNVKDAKRALREYYAPARYVPEFKTKAWVENGIRWIPCPAQIKEEVTCATCRLCMNDKKLKKMKAGIAFTAHGNRGLQMKKRLLND